MSTALIINEIDKNLSTKIPEKGGALTEGIIGTPRFVNPVLTISDADRDLTMLVYSGLLRSNNNQLVLDLAESYEIDEDELCYTFTLKPNLRWSDNMPLTSDDVIFTIEQIKNPTTKSPRRASWEGVEIEKIDEKNLSFCLQKPYAPFLENMTLGILPKHIWKDVLPEQMPLSIFNIEATGSGPYKIENISRNSSGIITSYTLKPNKNFPIQDPYLQKIILKFYPSEKELVSAYKSGEIDSLSALAPQKILEIKKDNSFIKTYFLSRVFAIFFNQDNAKLFAESEVRHALDVSTNKQKIVNEILKNFGTPISSPIPPGSIGFKETSTIQENINGDLGKAKDILERNGWKFPKTKPAESEDIQAGKDEEQKVLERKKGKELLRLEFSISTSNIPDLVQTAELIKQNWEELGAKVNLKIYEIGDLEQNVIRPREYDALLFGEIMGKDPDAFAFWHSSQRNDPGLNIAQYTNISADKFLEEARTTFDIKKREDKYFKFQEEIKTDAPAVFLYSPYFVHLLPISMKGVDEESITVSSERFSQIYKWHIKTKKVWKIFQ